MDSGKETRSLNSFTHRDFASMLYKYKYRLNIGDITGGTIFSREKKGFLVDIGEYVAAYLPDDEVSISKYKKTEPFANTSREFFIVAYNKKAKQLILSIKRLEYIRGWRRIKQIKKEDGAICLYINRVNKGGLITSFEGIQGFIPNSHIVNIKEKKGMVSQKTVCQILFINEKTNTIVLSQRRATLKKLLSKIYVGQNTKGVIAKIQHYGAFINIYGFLALLHISEINTETSSIKTLYVGKRISVQIIHIDTKQGRLSVSTKRLS
jgi:small subunit ribosomal protein S1